MNLLSPSHVENCTLRNALLWGMCQSHFYQVLTQSNLSARIAHLALAIFEAIPVFGQVVSLIELKIVRVYTYTPPQPISSIPQIPMIFSQENPTDVCRIWPTDLKHLGLTEAEKTEVDNCVREVFRPTGKDKSIRSDKKRLEYTEGGQSFSFPLPITLHIFLKRSAEDNKFHIVLLPKTVFASGGERKIRWAYDLTAGTFLLKKKVVGLFERKILEYLQPLRSARGIESSFIWRTSLDKLGQEKLQMIEPVRNGTINTLFGTALLSNFFVKRDLIIDLLADLGALHAGKIGVTVSCSNGGSFSALEPVELSYLIFHSDIKPLNVLVFFQNEKWRAELCDFGLSAAHPLGYSISVGFTPPEYIRFYKQNRPLGITTASLNENTFELAQFNITNGLGRDVWSMGLVILCLLVERQERVIWENHLESSRRAAIIPPLPCLKTILSGHMWNRYDEEGILDLSQETLDADLYQLAEEVVSKHPQERAEIFKIFEVLRCLMLRVDPEERAPISHCLALIQLESETSCA